jgi:hypothetical protein
LLEQRRLQIERARERNQAPGGNEPRISSGNFRRQFRAVLQCRGKRSGVAVDSQLFSTDALHEFALVPEADREILHEIDGISGLPIVLSLIRAPFDEAGPAGEGGEMKGKILLPVFGRNAENMQTFENSIFRQRRQFHQFRSAVANATGRPFALGEKPPGAVEALFPCRHGPGGMALVEKSLAPFDHLAIDLLDDLAAENAIAPAAESFVGGEKRKPVRALRRRRLFGA